MSAKPKAKKITKNVCNGDGECLEHTENEYKKFRNYVCDYSCKPVKCPNYIVCNNIAQQFALDCYGGKCKGCSISGIGPLVTKKSERCSRCLKKSLGLLRECGIHYFCVDCFKKAWYGHLEGGPEFPYSEEVCKEWEMLHRRLDRFLTKYPLIEDYDTKYDKWLDEQDIRDRRDEQKGLCQLCQ